MLKYSYTILYVQNVEETLAFYEKAFGFEQKFLTPEKDYGELDTGTTTLAFADYSIPEYNGVEISKHNKKLASPAFELTFVTENIDIDFKIALEAGAEVVKQPEAKPWGQTVGYLKDLNGFLVELCTPVG
jgi:lactoylglutathione lyase